MHDELLVKICPQMAEQSKKAGYAATAFCVLLSFTLLNYVLILGIGLWRMLRGMANGRSPAWWKAGDSTQDGPFYQRLMRCHANMFENIGFFLVVLLACVQFPDVVPLQVFKFLCTCIFVGRFGQIFIYMLGANSLFVLIRFTFFGLQLFPLTFMTVTLLSHLHSL